MASSLSFVAFSWARGRRVPHSNDSHFHGTIIHDCEIPHCRPCIASFEVWWSLGVKQTSHTIFCISWLLIHQLCAPFTRRPFQCHLPHGRLQVAGAFRATLFPKWNSPALLAEISHWDTVQRTCWASSWWHRRCHPTQVQSWWNMCCSPFGPLQERLGMFPKNCLTKSSSFREAYRSCTELLLYLSMNQVVVMGCCCWPFRVRPWAGDLRGLRWLPGLWRESEGQTKSWTHRGGDGAAIRGIQATFGEQNPQLDWIFRSVRMANLPDIEHLESGIHTEKMRVDRVNQQDYHWTSLQWL